MLANRHSLTVQEQATQQVAMATLDREVAGLSMLTHRCMTAPVVQTVARTHVKTAGEYILLCLSRL